MTDIPKLEMPVAIGLMGAGVYEIHKLYVQHAGSLSDARTATPGDGAVSARILDADVLCGATALLVGASIALASRRTIPLAVAVVGFLLVSAYYHATFIGPSPVTIASVSNDDD